MIINDLDGYYIVFDTKNWNTELDTLSFRYSNSNIQFRTPKCLKRYTKVKEWDNEYIVCIGHSCYWTGNKPDLPVIPCFTSKKW